MPGVYAQTALDDVFMEFLIGVFAELVSCTFRAGLSDPLKEVRADELLLDKLVADDAIHGIPVVTDA